MAMVVAASSASGIFDSGMTSVSAESSVIDLSKYIDDSLKSLLDNPNLNNIKEISLTDYNCYAYFENEDGKFGLKHNGEVVLEAEWEDIVCDKTRQSDWNSAKMRKNNEVFKVSEDYFISCTYSMTSRGNTICAAESSDYTFIPVKSNGKWGCIRLDDKKQIIPCEYKEIVADSSIIRFLTFDDKFGYMDSDSNILVDAKYDYAISFPSNKISVVGRDYGYTVIDMSGKEIIPLVKTEPNIINDDLFYINDTENDILTVYSSDGTKLFEKNKVSLIDFRDGIFNLKTFDYDHDGNIMYKDNQICDINGNILIDGAGKYDNFIFMSHDAPIAWIGSNPVYSKNDFPMVIAAQSSERNSEGIMSLDYYNAEGMLIAEDYQSQGGYDCGEELIQVYKNGKYGFIDRFGNVIFNPQFDEVNYPFVQIGDKIGVINTNGTYEKEPAYVNYDTYSIYRVSDGKNMYYLYNITSENDMFVGTGLMNERGETVIAPGFTSIYFNEAEKVTLCYDNYGAGPMKKYVADFSENPIAIDESECINAPNISCAVIDWFRDNGYVFGSDEELRLSEKITRAEFLTLLSRVDGWDVTEADTPAFADTAAHWANSIILEAKNRNLVSGDEFGNFNPDTAITYEQEFTILLRALNISVNDSNELVSIIGRSEIANMLKTSYSYGWDVSRRNSLLILYGYLDKGKSYVYDPQIFEEVPVCNNELMMYYFM